MKRITLLSILLAVLSLDNYAQSNYKRFKETIDKYLQSSIKLDRTPYNTKVYLNKNEDTTSLETKQNKAYLTISLKDSIHFNKIITKLIHTSDTTYDPRLLTAIFWIYHEFIFCKALNIKTKRKMVEWSLKHSECFYTNARDLLSAINSSRYYNKRAKQRIRELLTADTLQLSQKAIKVNRLQEIQRLNIGPDTSEFFKKAYKKDSTQLSYAEWFDSTYFKNIYNTYKKDSVNKNYLKWKKDYYISKKKKKTFNNYSISKYPIISIIANANLKGFIPELEKMYNENTKYEDRIRLVLAKFGYKDFPKKALNHIKQQVKEDKYKIMDYEDKLYYIGTQEAFAYFGEFLKTDLEKDCGDAYMKKNGIRNYGYYVLYRLSHNILNIPARDYVTSYLKKLNRDRDVPYKPFHSFCHIIPHYPDNILPEILKQK